MHTAALVAIVLIIAYALLIFSFYTSWKKTPEFYINDHQPGVFVSVIVPIKNEIENIENLIELLAQQNYNKDNFEIIIINDHSTDNAENKCSKYLSQISNLRWFNLPENQQGKKAAIHFGVSLAKGDLILTTDADCRMGKHWVETFAYYYKSRNDKLIIGPVLMDYKKGIVDQFFYLDQLSMAATTAGSALMGNPIMCSGANLAFEKVAFEEVWHEMEVNIPSGDVMFLLIAVKKRWPGNIGYLKSTDALITTITESGLKAYLQQRQRWVSKGKYYTDNYIVGIAILVGCLNLLLFALGISALFYPSLLILYLLIYALKFIADTPLLVSFSKFYTKKSFNLFYILAQFIYPIYVVFIGFYGIFGSYKWKNRLYKS
jgi:cellulose synthase/poly-beta-1,6-N-acetylglucosamine synthase-like glycosyltransferase